MDGPHYTRVRELVLKVMDQPGPLRTAWLSEACAGDADLEAEVLALLAQDRPSADLEVRILPEGLLPATPAPTGEMPTSIGPYVVTGLLGEGGMGVVYRARQEAPIRREVAVKVLRGGFAAGLGTDRILERFAWERRSLARMDHPHIARILDAGAADGSPYVVLELVDGEPITRWCDENGTGLDRRLDIMLHVCRAVQHAHERGVLHRDLKPGNILVRAVDGKPVPSVIDFGIAKALDADDDLTLDGQRVGTPAYMSPEQAAVPPGPVDVRTDVYALGCVLYELVGGRRMARDPGEPEPPAPGSGAPDDLSWRRRLKGDLDRICLMAVRSDPARRYAGAGALADDLARFLAGRPVAAMPDSWGYRARKAARRHPLRVAMVTAALGFAVAGVAFLGYHADRLETEKTRALAAEASARDEAAAAAEIAGFLERLFTDADPISGGAADTPARELLDQGAHRLADELAGQPRVRGRLYGVLGRVMHGMGMPARSVDLLQAGLADLTVGDTTQVALERAEVLALLGTALHDVDRFAEAEAAMRRALPLYRQEQGGPTVDQVWVTVDLATYVQAQGRLDEARNLMEEALALGEAVGPEAVRAVAWTRNMLGYLLAKEGRYHEAGVVFRDAYGAQRAVMTGDDIELVNTLNNLGNMALMLGDLREADRRATEALDMLRRMVSGDHPAVARALKNLALVRLEQGHLATADSLMDESVGMNRRVLGDTHRHTLTARIAQGRIHQRMGRLDEAAAALEQVQDETASTLGPDHDHFMRALVRLGSIRLERGEYEQARLDLEEALAGLGAYLDEEHPRLDDVRLDLAEALLALGDESGAAAMLRPVVPRMEALYGDDDRRSLRARALLASLPPEPDDDAPRPRAGGR